MTYDGEVLTNNYGQVRPWIQEEKAPIKISESDADEDLKKMMW